MKWFKFRKKAKKEGDDAQSMQNNDAKKKRRFRFRIPFLSRIDRYLIGKFLGTYFFSILLIISIAVVFDYNEKIDNLTENHANWFDIVFVYYLNFIPYYVNLFSSLFIFLSVIFFTTKLASNNEFVAMRAAGVKFSRIMRPYMISATLISVITFFLGSEVIPRGSVKRLAFENLYTCRPEKRNPTWADNVQMQVDTGVIAYVGHYENTIKRCTNFSLDKFHNKKLVSHLTASHLIYDTLANERYHWKLYNVDIRELKTNREYLTHYEELDSVIIMEPRDFLTIRDMQQTMTNEELMDMVDKQRIRGNGKVAQFEIEYYKRFASPFASFILTTIGLTLACKKRKNGMGLALGVGLALSAIYILLDSISATFSINAGLAPMLAAWLPNIIFSFIALYLFLKAPR